MSKPEANRLYASVILHGRINEEESPDVDTSVRVIEHGKYFVTVRELANSMKKEGFVLSHVMEVGIQNIMMNLPPDSKKLVMPVRSCSCLYFFTSGSDAKHGIEQQGAHFPVQEVESLGP
ncbi:hypothetical protein VPH35_067810 [Triticum aestivum]